mmetsp:Transcript_2844/g.6699  ORF Transcript_2844/g.6699 Transcript_2844/m.6699 type:complete len:110 (-) Transcript_2844:1197-1526(-)
MVVRPFAAFSSASWTIRSLAESKALVASSNRRILGSRTSARAIATRCFCPPDSIAPRSPITVSYFSGNFIMKLWAFAILAAASISSMLTSRGTIVGLPSAPIFCCHGAP